MFNGEERTGSHQDFQRFNSNECKFQQKLDMIVEDNGRILLEKTGCSSYFHETPSNILRHEKYPNLLSAGKWNLFEKRNINEFAKPNSDGIRLNGSFQNMNTYHEKSFVNDGMKISDSRHNIKQNSINLLEFEKNTRHITRNEQYIEDLQAEKRNLIVNYQFTKKNKCTVKKPTKKTENQTKTFLTINQPASKISLKLDMSNETNQNGGNTTENAETNKIEDEIERKYRDNPRVSIQQGSASTKHSPWVGYSNKRRYSKSESTGRNFVIDNDSNFSTFSPSLYVNPPYFGCNEDCNGTKYKNNVNPNVTFPGIPVMENASVVPMFSNHEFFQDVSTGEKTSKSPDIRTHQEHFPQKCLNSLCTCNTQFNNNDVGPKVSEGEDDPGIPHQSYDCSDLSKNLHQCPFDLRREIFLGSNRVGRDEINQNPRLYRNEDYQMPHKCCGMSNNIQSSVSRPCNEFKAKKPETKLYNHPVQRITQSTVTDPVTPQVDPSRNITIQIIPNCYHVKSCTEAGQTFHVPDKPFEVTMHPNNCNETKCVKGIESIQNQPSGQISQISRSHTHMPGYSFNQCRSRGTRERQMNRWWSCSWRRRRHDYQYRRRPMSITHNTSTSTEPNIPTECQKVEPVCDEYKMAYYQECQRVMPVQSVYNHRNENLLKSLRLNKGLVREFFATPCPSSSSGCINSCIRKIRGPPFPMCASTTAYCDTKSPVTNQCTQYESTCKEENDYSNDSNQQKLLCECLKYLTKKMSRDDSYEIEEEIEDCCCCCCCQNYNTNCCCCCQNVCHRSRKKPKSYTPELTIVTHKTDEKPSAPSCITRCKSVEAKQSCKNCGTVISAQCFKTVETTCTNTELNVAPKPEIRRKIIRCCKPKCCNCCRQTPPCCCRSNSHCCQSHLSCCHHEQMMYYCQCYHEPFNNGEPLLRKCIEMLKAKSSMTVQTENVSTAKIECVSKTTKSEVKNGDVESRSNLNTVTLDLCNLGDKKFSKFGVPSRQYHWTNQDIIQEMPREIYRFAGDEAKLTMMDEIHDPTPCLKPEVLYNAPEIKNESLSPLAAGDIKQGRLARNTNLSAICEALFSSEKKTEINTSNGVANLSWIIENKSSFLNKKATLCNESTKSIPAAQCSTRSTKINTNQNNHDESTNTLPTSNESETKAVVPMNKVSNRRLNSLTSLKNKQDQNKSKTSMYMATTYTPKPFTTKTGLMSFIPPFRDTSRSWTHTKRATQDTQKYCKFSKKEEPSEKPKPIKNGPRVSSPKLGAKASTFCRKNNILKSQSADNHKQECGNENNKTELESKISILEENKAQLDIHIVNDCAGVEDENQANDKEEQPKQDEVNMLPSKVESKSIPFSDLKRFEDEINSFSNKCFNAKKSSNDFKIPALKTNVSDIVKSLEFGRAIYNCKTRPLFSSLWHPKSEDVESHSDNALGDFLYDNSDNKITSFSGNPIDGEFFNRQICGPISNVDIHIPRKILSKNDLLSLN